MTAVYETYFYDHDGVPQLLLQGAKYTEFHQRINKPWNHVLRINVPYPDTRIVPFFRDTLQRDFQIKIFRRDPDKQADDASDLVYEGFHRTLVDQVGSDGVVEFTSYGTGYLNLLSRRIVIPPAGQTHSLYSAVAETAMKSFVDDQCINPTDTTRVISGLSNEADAGLGQVATYNARYTKLSTVISRLAEQGQVDFGIVGNTTDYTKFEFQVRENWGIDRTQGNTDGNDPTVFSLFFGNMTIPILSRNGADEVTHVYVGGQGEGVDRTIREVVDTDAEAISPWNRIESFVDARQEGTTDGLDTAGQKYLSEHNYNIKFTFNIQETAGTKFLEDWKLGDIITAKYFDQEFSMKINEVSITITEATQSGGELELIQAELLDVT